jgi:hypothetical protein
MIELFALSLLLDGVSVARVAVLLVGFVLAVLVVAVFVLAVLAAAAEQDRIHEVVNKGIEVIAGLAEPDVLGVDKRQEVAAAS